VRLRHSPQAELDLGAHPATEGLEVVEIDESGPPPPPPPIHLLEGLPPVPEAEYQPSAADTTGSKGIWTAIEHLERTPRGKGPGGTR
jgi:hypothetical protein